MTDELYQQVRSITDHYAQTTHEAEPNKDCQNRAASLSSAHDGSLPIRPNRCKTVINGKKADLIGYMTRRSPLIHMVLLMCLCFGSTPSQALETSIVVDTPVGSLKGIHNTSRYERVQGSSVCKRTTV